MNITTVQWGTKLSQHLTIVVRWQSPSLHWWTGRNGAASGPQRPEDSASTCTCRSSSGELHRSTDRPVTNRTGGTKRHQVAVQPDTGTSCSNWSHGHDEDGCSENTEVGLQLQYYSDEWPHPQIVWVYRWYCQAECAANHFPRWRKRIQCRYAATTGRLAWTGRWPGHAVQVNVRKNKVGEVRVVENEVHKHSWCTSDWQKPPWSYDYQYLLSAHRLAASSK